MTKRTSGPPFPSREELLAFIRENPQATSTRDIVRAFGLRGRQLAALRQTLSELARSGELPPGLRARARPLLKQLDIDGAAYRDLIEQELTARLGNAGGDTTGRAAPGARRSPSTATRLVCGTCDASNERDAKFCKQCGAEL